MNFIKNIPIYIKNFFMISAFNFGIMLGIVSEGFVEGVLKSYLKRTTFIGTDYLIDVLKKKNYIVTFKKEEMNIKFDQLRMVMIEQSIISSDSIIWNKSLSEKLRTRILKEYFRKVSWELRCSGLEFNSEVPSI